MSCGACEEFDVEIPIHGPDHLRGIILKLRNAVAAGRLSYNAFESERALMGQKRFMDLDVDGFLPDVLCYYFDCPSCKAVYSLEVETYHGSGGKWSRLR